MFTNSKRGRVKFGALENPDKFAEYVGKTVLKHTDHLFHTGHAERVANEILKDASRKRPKYNNYSGNLNRSYMVKARFGHVEFEYMTPENVAAKPLLYEQSSLPTQRWAGRFDRPRRKGEIDDFVESRGGKGKPDWLNGYKTADELTWGEHRPNRKYFRLRKQRHAIKKSMRAGRGKGKYYNREDRYLRSVKKEEEKFSGNGYMHRYRERTKYDYEAKEYVRAADARNRSLYQFSLMNLTPYAGAVERRGYQVLDYGRVSLYRKIVKKICGQAVTTSVKWTCDRANRDRGRFSRE